jgi:hypothetical protein
MRFFWLLQIGVILLVPPSIWAWHHRADRARALKGAALLLVGMDAVFFGMFAIGEVLSDPGGWRAVAWTAAWLVPLGALSVLAVRQPDLAAAVLGLVLVGLLGMSLWVGFEPGTWAAFEDTHGPIRAVWGIAVSVPIALLGVQRPLRAGAMLVTVAALPLLVIVLSAARGLGPAGWPSAVVTAPVGIAGALLLMASASSSGRVRSDVPGRLTPTAF